MPKKATKPNQPAVLLRGFREWTIHVIAECQECDWSTQDFQTGKAEAARHHRRTGHEVHGEVGKAFRYGERA